MSLSVYSRALIASYLFQRGVLAWECTLCGKLFCLTADEAVQRVPLTKPPAYIEREFRLHSCMLVLLVKQERVLRASSETAQDLNLHEVV